MTTKKALITGINGQDGGYLAEFLLEKGYEVHGMYRRCSAEGHLANVNHLGGKMQLHCADLTDMASLHKVIKEIMPDELYNLAAQSHVGKSFDQPFITHEINWLGVERILDLIKDLCPNCKIYQASTSELFGQVEKEGEHQNEQTPFNPVSPYAASKHKAHKAISRERENGMFACAGILFNHESPRRGVEFVTRKITDAVARIKLGMPQRETGKTYIEIGNLNAKRDWGYAGDYVEAMWKMLQQEKPKDYVVGTGKQHTIRELAEAAFKSIGLEITWKGEGINEEGYDQNGRKVLAINPKYFRPNEVPSLQADASKAKEELGWKPKVTFEELIAMMVESDIKYLQKQL